MRELKVGRGRQLGKEAKKKRKILRKKIHSCEFKKKRKKRERKKEIFLLLLLLVQRKLRLKTRDVEWPGGSNT
jgi:hypothetical protein